MFALLSPEEVLSGIAARMKRRRIGLGLTQRELSARAGVSYSSLRVFEETGRIALASLVRLAFALGAEAEFAGLFPPPPPGRLEDVLEKPERKRARRR